MTESAIDSFPNGKPKTSDGDAKGEQDVNWNLGNWCNEYAAEDTQNLLAFIKVRRATVDRVWMSVVKYTCADFAPYHQDSYRQRAYHYSLRSHGELHIHQTERKWLRLHAKDGWNDANGQKLADASGFVGDGALDYITVMTHDVASVSPSPALLGQQ